MFEYVTELSAGDGSCWSDNGFKQRLRANFLHREERAWEEGSFGNLKRCEKFEIPKDLVTLAVPMFVASVRCIRFVFYVSVCLVWLLVVDIF